MTTSKLDEMIAEARTKAQRMEMAQRERERAERIAAAKAVIEKAEEMFTALLGADLYAELGVAVHAEKSPTSAVAYYGVGTFTYADEEWHLKYDDYVDRFGGVSTRALIVDAPALPDARRWDAKRRGTAHRITSQHATQLLVILAAYGEEKAAQLAEQERQEWEAEERATRQQGEAQEREERVKRDVEAAKAAEAEILSEAEVYFAEKRAGMWRWPTGYILTLYHWRWCVGYNADGGAEYDGAYSLQEALPPDGWLHTFEARPRTLKLIPEAHKPVVERKTFSSVAELDPGLYFTVRATYGANSIRRTRAGEWPNEADVWAWAKEGEWTSGIERTLGYIPMPHVATFIDAQAGEDAPRDPLPSLDGGQDERPYVEDLPF